MATSAVFKARIKKLKDEYDRLRVNKESLLQLLDEAEMAEAVYNSNAIENSTLSLPETEKILLEAELPKKISTREVFEAKNLAQVMKFVQVKSLHEEFSKEVILIIHKLLLTNIADDIAGRFRGQFEYVRVGTHIAPAPEHVERMLEEIILEYSGGFDSYFIDKIAKFHLDFENIHPFNDGNGRIGRVIINFQLYRIGFPTLIIRDKEKDGYYEAFQKYRSKNDVKPMEKIVLLALTESLHKRITYLEGKKIIPLFEYAKQQGKPAPIFLNAARRQTIPAFRERGVWKIGLD